MLPWFRRHGIQGLGFRYHESIVTQRGSFEPLRLIFSINNWFASGGRIQKPQMEHGWMTLDRF